MRLTAKNVAGLKLPKDKSDFIAFDDRVPGLGYRLRAGGGATWIFQYALGRAKQRRMTIGKATAITPDKARELAADLHAKVRLGGDPAGEKAENKSRSGETFEACMKLYLERRRNEGKLRASSFGEIERHLTRNLRALHDLRIDQVNRRAIALELGRLGTESGPVQANRTRASLVKFLNWCAGEGFIDANPATFTNKNPEEARTRVLSMAELKTIWCALPNGDFGDVVKLLMLTAQRAREISNLQWDELDLNRNIITLPPARTKNRRWHTVHIASTAAAILKTRTPNVGRDFVFGTGQHGFSGWSKAKARLDEKLKLAPWIIHDLRRAAATHMGEIGILPHIVEACLGHVSGAKAGIAGRYNKAAYESEKAIAFARWSEHLMATIEGRDTNITPLKRA
jgi:integrase